jgi:SWI/SNF-related matrix-associated actin-dependent regulator of chromatin subfamily D
MWELRVEGRLIDDPPQQQLPTTATSTQISNRAMLMQPKRKFSSFFKSLVIELDKNIYGPDNHLVEWHRTPQTGETDGFQVCSHIGFTFLFDFDCAGETAWQYGC